MNNNFYVYLHNRKSDGAPFYVGKGCGKRAWRFSKRNNHWNAVASKHGVEVEILFNGLTEDEAFAEEISIISELKYFGYELANKTNGGEGVSGSTPWNKGVKATSVSAGLKEYYKNNISARKGIECYGLWDNPNANRDVWANAPLVYSYWIRGAGPKQLSRIFKDFESSAFVKLTEEFKLGFVPMENKGWLNQFKEPPKKLNENPFALLKKVHKFDVYMRAEEVFSLYREGKGSKAIAKIIGCDYQNLTGILLKFEKGWSPLDDEVFSFIKTRAMVENLDE